MTSPVEHPGSPRASPLACSPAGSPRCRSCSADRSATTSSHSRSTDGRGVPDPAPPISPTVRSQIMRSSRSPVACSGSSGSPRSNLRRLGALPKGIAVGGAWHSSAGSYAAAPGVRLHPHHDVEVLTAIVAIGDGLEIAGPTASCDPQQDVASAAVTRRSGGDARCRHACPALESGAIPACRHRVNGGPARRSFLLFFVGDEERCHSHGRRDCRCGAVAGILRIYHWLHWAAAARQVLDRDEASSPS